MGYGIINVCFSCDDYYAKYAGVAIASILLNANDDDEFYFWILDNGISENTKIRIERLKSIRYFDLRCIGNNSKDYKLKFAQLLPKTDRIIYLDSDIIVKKSLSGLYNINLDNSFIAGVTDKNANNTQSVMNYLNTGVMLIDLNKIRQYGVENKFAQYAKMYNINTEINSACVINNVLSKYTKTIDGNWNVQVANFMDRSSYTKTPGIIHYTGKQKPWLFGTYNYFKNEYFKVLKHTPWAISTDEQLKWGIWNNICSVVHFVINNPQFIVQSEFWQALFKTIS